MAAGIGSMEQVMGAAQRAALQGPTLRGVGAGEAPRAVEGFRQMLAQGIEQANGEHVRASDEVGNMVKTQGANLHEAMIALSRAEIALRVTTRVGQKLVQGYQELSRMQI